jgi:hypothetical protein
MPKGITTVTTLFLPVRSLLQSVVAFLAKPVVGGASQRTPLVRASAARRFAGGC